ncbi:MAG: glycosyltransferase family 4 protein [Desulfobulbaceae bacterium]|nr:glycosyltransferase family 4 protein [Desulfobulbaceae bacterium]
MKDKQNKIKLLAIGFLPPPLGGVSVSFKIFCDLVLKRDDVDLRVTNLFEMRHNDRLISGVLKFLIKTWHDTGWSDVVKLYCATSQVPTIALIVEFICRIRRKPFILRKAAGFDHRDLGPIKGRISEFVVKRADLFLVQTKYLEKACRNRGIIQTRWYPTTRLLGPQCKETKRCRHFIYVGHVRASKGLNELIEVAGKLTKPCDIDVYGPFFDGMTEAVFQDKLNIHYRGVLEPEHVQEKMSEYDAFVLPSKAHSEGYPGTILEALSVGLPVISTTVGGIPEIVDDRCGILVSPGNVEALFAAMNRLISDEAYYQRLCQNVLEVRECFSAVSWGDWFVTQCERLNSISNV